MITEKTPFEFETSSKTKVRDWLQQEELWTKLPGLSTKMDTWALLDHTLAHELTHTWKGGETNIFDTDRGRKEQYGEPLADLIPTLQKRVWATTVVTCAHVPPRPTLARQIRHDRYSDPC